MSRAELDEENDIPDTDGHVAHPGMTRGLTLLFAIAGGAAVGNLYWAQPLLADIAVSLGVSTGAAGLLVTLTQAGYALGVFLLVPLGDSLDRRRLVPAVMVASAAALATSALATTFAVLLLSLALVGLTTVTGQLLTPLAGDLASDEQRGAVVGTVASGLLTGILLSRTISGLLADAFGWRAVYAVAAVVTLGLSVVLARALPAVATRPRLRYGALLRSVFQTVGRHRSAQVTLVLGSTAFCVFTLFWTGLTFLLSSPPYSYSVTQIGLVGLAGLSGALAARRAGMLHDRGWSVPGTGAALGLTLVSLGVAGLGRTSIILVLVAVVLLDMAVQAVNVLNQTRLFAIDAGARSRLNTAFVTSNFVGGAVGSMLAAVLWHQDGWSAVTLGGALLTVVALAVWWSQRSRSLAVA